MKLRWFSAQRKYPWWYVQVNKHQPDYNDRNTPAWVWRMFDRVNNFDLAVQHGHPTS